MYKRSKPHHTMQYINRHLTETSFVKRSVSANQVSVNNVIENPDIDHDVVPVVAVIDNNNMNSTSVANKGHESLLLKTHLNQSNGGNTRLQPDLDELPPLHRSMCPSITLLCCFSLFPWYTDRYRKLSHVATIVWSLGTLAFLAHILRSVTFTLITYKQHFHVLHALTISGIITGAKPLVCLINMLILMWKRRRHAKFLAALSKFDNEFYEDFKCRAAICTLNIRFLGLTFAVFVVMLGVRVVDQVYNGVHSYVDVKSLFSWQELTISFQVTYLMTATAIPVFYYMEMNILMRFYSRHLCAHMKIHYFEAINSGFRAKPIREYYKMFLNMANLQRLLGKTFKLFILFTVVWAVFSLCLAIYFGTQSEHLFPNQPAWTVGIMTHSEWLLILTTNTAYASLQIFVAIVCLFTVCFSGILTNETTREMNGLLLSDIPADLSSDDRYHLMCFDYKLRTQASWGPSIWLAFPLERRVFITLMSMIVTYSFLLLKLRRGAEESLTDIMKDALSITHMTEDVVPVPEIDVDAVIDHFAFDFNISDYSFLRL